MRHAQAIGRLVARMAARRAPRPFAGVVAGWPGSGRATLGLPLVYEIRAFWEDAAVGNGMGRAGSVKYRLTRELENHVVSGANAVMTICRGLRDDLIARGFAGDRIGIMPNGVDLALFGKPTPRDDALAHELGLGVGAR